MVQSHTQGRNIDSYLQVPVLSGEISDSSGADSEDEKTAEAAAKPEGDKEVIQRTAHPRKVGKKTIDKNAERPKKKKDEETEEMKKQRLMKMRQAGNMIIAPTWGPDCCAACEEPVTSYEKKWTSSEGGWKHRTFVRIASEITSLDCSWYSMTSLSQVSIDSLRFASILNVVCSN